MESPIWNDLDGYDGYQISDQGQVRRNDGVLLVTSTNQFGVDHVVLRDHQGKQVRRSLALLVATTFIERPNELLFDTPIHLNGDRTDNRASNLMWRPRWFAISYQRQFLDNRVYSYGSPIYLVDTDEVFETIREAAMKYGLLEKDIFMDIVNQRGVWPLAFQFLLHRP